MKLKTKTKPRKPEVDPATVPCSICYAPRNDEHGHNAWPVNEGRCCKRCNAAFVVPIRILRAIQEENTLAHREGE